jgi:cell division protein ZapD
MRPAAARDLAQWTRTFWPLGRKPFKQLLQMLRESGSSQKVMATAGQLQQNLPQGRTFQLLRLKIDPSLGHHPRDQLQPIAGGDPHDAPAKRRQIGGHHR